MAKLADAKDLGSFVCEHGAATKLGEHGSYLRMLLGEPEQANLSLVALVVRDIDVNRLANCLGVESISGKEIDL